MRILQLTLTVLFLATSSEDTSAQGRSEKWQCLLPSIPGSRVVELNYLGEKDVPCQAFDRKGLSVQRIANYQNSAGGCEAQVNSLVTKLEAGGYFCVAPDAKTHMYRPTSEGTAYSPYWYALLDLRVDGDNVTGILRPLLGDLTPPKKVTGNYVTDQGAEIEIHDYFGDPAFDSSDGWPTSLTLSLEGNPADGFSGEGISPPPPGGFSQRDMTIYQTECGPFSREVYVRYSRPGIFGKKRSTPSEILDATRKYPEFFGQTVRSYLPTGKKDQYGDPEYEWVDRPLSDFLLNPNEEDLDMRTIVVDHGKETAFVQAARRTGVFSESNLLFGVCDAVSARALTFPLAAQFLANVDRTGLVELITAELTDILSSGPDQLDYRVEKQDFDFFDDDPYGGIVIIPVAVASEVSRGVPGQWDTFETAVRFGRQGDGSLYFDIWADRAKTVKRGARSQVPDSSFFTTEMRQEERRIAGTLALAFLDWCKKNVDANLVKSCRMVR